MVDKDILSFLDSKFAKLDKKPKKSAKKPNNSELLQALQAQAEVKPSLSTQNLYQPLVTDTELNVDQAKESGGVKAFKTFQLAKPSMYESHIKDKVFFIGQNAVQGKDPTVEA